MINLKEFVVKYNPKDGYAPKAGDEKKFRDKHKVQKTADANKNGDDVFAAANVKAIERNKEKHGYNPGQDQDVYEEKDDNPPFKGPYKKAPGTIVDKSGAKHTPMSRVRDISRQAMKKQAAAASVKKEEVELEEVLNPSMGADAYIKDFVDSKNPKFAGKSKKERTQQALAAYYAAKRGK
jgi:hypothetical protein